MVTTILTHEVKNFSDWKKGFDADAGNRRSFNINVKGLYQSAENPNMVTVLTEASSVEAVKKFIDSPELKHAMEGAGVVGKPEFKILNEVRVLNEV